MVTTSNITTAHQSFTLDSLGNISSVTTGGSGGTTQNDTTNSENELTTSGAHALAYDNNGNLTTDDQGHTLVYDAWNRLVQVKSGATVILTYAYDGLKRRITENSGTATNTATNMYFSGTQIVEERQAGAVTAQELWSPLSPDTLILRDTYSAGAATRLYFTHDANANITTALDASGAVLEHLVYDAYGKFIVTNAGWTAQSSDTLGLKYTFQGGRWEALTGLVHFGARDQSVSILRWIQAEPSGASYVDGLNLYQADAANPINFVDPAGTKESRSRLAGGDFVEDAPGLQILLHWLYGGGAELDINADTDEQWTNYLQANENLRSEVASKLILNPEIRSLHGKPIGTIVTFDFSMHGDLGNGESVTGYNYLDGTNQHAGDFHIKGTAKLLECKRIAISADYTWNDIIHAGPYDTDTWKSRVGRVISIGMAKDYTIRISWHDDSELSDEKFTGWPFVLKEYTWKRPGDDAFFEIAVP